MNKFIALFSLQPVLRGLIAMIISGAVFPVCGVMVLRLNLVPMRYMLMHGVILGGAISLSLHLPMIPSTLAVNLILVLFMLFTSSKKRPNFSGGSAATMVLSMALASLIMHISDVPAKDTLDLLWGSPFALTKSDLIILCEISVILLLYVIINFHNIQNIFYNQEIAASSGINVRLHYTVMVIIIALVIAVAMKLLGAFLIDALLILPVLSAAGLQKAFRKNGLKKLFILSSISGFIISTAGYITAVMTNLPPTAAIALLAGIFFVIGKAANLLKNRSKK
ncbi:MAG: metal ABC transporter permease [Treponema sp.]|nr:metal ABC transporter permease [Treponema sp.]